MFVSGVGDTMLATELRNRNPGRVLLNIPIICSSEKWFRFMFSSSD